MAIADDMKTLIKNPWVTGLFTLLVVVYVLYLIRRASVRLAIMLEYGSCFCVSTRSSPKRCMCAWY